MSVQDAHIGADVFRWGGLGKSAWRVWRILPFSVGTTRGELAGRLPHMHHTTLGRALQRLEQHGLARSDGAGMWRRVVANLDQVARRVGTAGARERQREQHAQQRLVYRHLSATRRTRR